MINAAQQWSGIALDAMKDDFSGTSGPEITGPGRTSRLFGMVHAAFHDAYVSGVGAGKPYRFNTPAKLPPSQVLGQLSGGRSAYQMLSYFYNRQREALKAKYSAFVDALKKEPKPPSSDELSEAERIGDLVATQLLVARLPDTEGAPPPFTPLPKPRTYGAHDGDPISGNTKLYGEFWGLTAPFLVSKPDLLNLRVNAPPRLDSKDYRESFDEVKNKGNVKRRDFKIRETVLGYFWAYDGTNRIGTPPRFFNQILHAIATSDGLSEAQWSELLCRSNLAMADAAISAWDVKYFYYFWRPVIGIRRDLSVPDATWEPVGSPATYNTYRTNFTPPFPSYTSGHATFVAACFETVKLFRHNALGRDLSMSDRVDLEIVSEELDGQAYDQDQSKPRPRIPIRYTSVDQMIQDCMESRIWLGVHWRFDGTNGKEAGLDLAKRAYGKM